MKIVLKYIMDFPKQNEHDRSFLYLKIVSSTFFLNSIFRKEGPQEHLICIMLFLLITWMSPGSHKVVDLKWGHSNHCVQVCWINSPHLSGDRVSALSLKGGLPFIAFTPLPASSSSAPAALTFSCDYCCGSTHCLYFLHRSLMWIMHQNHHLLNHLLNTYYSLDTFL